MFALASNGVLRSPSPSSGDFDASSNTASFALASNGLLGDAIASATFQPSSTLSSHKDPLCDPAVVWSSPGQLINTGLLTSTARSNEVGNDISQDDELPDTFQVFGNRSSAQRPLSALSSTPATSSYISRLSIKCRTFDGRTVLLRRRSKPSAAATASNPLSIPNLLDTPIHRMMEELSVETATKLSRQDTQATGSRANKNPNSEDTLWVERYRPKRFVELVGNERVARDVLSWVKLWDWCVFRKRKAKIRSKDFDEELVDDDEYRRPRQKLLLISGPPGLGKTTLAHVVASQAGYEVVEINASDARSGQIVDERIRPTLEAGSTLRSSKPVLVVIDEIDGATGGGETGSSFVHKLVQLTQDKPGKKYSSGKKRDPHTKRPILRPIICICNDPNAASLAKLRPHAHQIRLARPADVHVVKRLREICSVEGLKAETRSLTTLVGIAKGDLRACLNTLQVIKSRNEPVTEAVVRRATIGMKEVENSQSSVLNSLFIPLSKKRVHELALTEAGERKYVGRLCREIESTGRENNIATGCFAHYPTLRQQDANFSRYEKADDWLGTFDILSASMYSDGEFALNQYLPYMLVPFYHLFQARGNPKVERSQEDWEHYQTVKANEEIYKSLSRCLQTAGCRLGGDYRQFIASPILELEFAPYINRIISPPLRPVNSQVIRPGERALLQRLVGIMATLDLRFVQERAEDGQLSYRLDPPIDVFINYEGKRAPDIVATRYAVRHLVAGEIDARSTSRQADVADKGKKAKRSDFFGRDKRPATEDASGDAEPASKRSRKDLTDIADKPPVDFFGRLIDVSAKQTTGLATKKPAQAFRVSFKYAEGNSAAVRKPVKLASFL